MAGPRRHGIALQAFPSYGGGHDVRIMYNQIIGGAGQEDAIQARDIDDLQIKFNTIDERQRGIWCFRIGGNSVVAKNAVSQCTEAGIIIRGNNTGGELEEGLLLKCNRLTKNGTAIRIDDGAELPVHLTQFGNYTVETDPGNQFIDNDLDIDNENPNFTWLYYVLDAANLWLNPPLTTNGNVNLVDLQNEGRYACDEEPFAQTPIEVSSRAAEASRLGNTASSIAPNPAREAFQLSLAEQWQGQQVAIDIIDVSGKVVQQLSTRQYKDSNIQVSTQNLQAGYYFCRVSGATQQTEVIKLVVVN